MSPHHCHRLPRFGLVAIVLLGLLALGGCAAQEQLDEGDLALQQEQYATAVKRYEQALEHKPALADDPAFAENLRLARRGKAFSSGQQRLRMGDWERAIDDFEQALELDPGYEPARAALAEARQGGASLLYGEAVDAAERGDLSAAARALEEALTHRPEDRDAQLALGSIRQPQAYPVAGVVQRQQQGEALADQRAWRRALEQFEQVIAEAPQYLPARSAATRARNQLAEATELYEQGRAQARARELAPATATLEQALTVWPGNEQAETLLASVRRQRQEANEQTRAAASALEQGEWDTAIASAERALGIEPGHAEAARLAATARDRAATHHVQAGQARLDAGDLAAARAAFQEAMAYRPNSEPARAGLATVARQHAMQAEQAGRPGLALLYHLRAAQHQPGSMQADRASSLRDQLAREAGFALQVRADIAGAQAAAESASFEPVLIRALSRAAPPMVRVGAGPFAAEGPTYRADVQVLDVAIDEQLARREDLRHRYDVRYEVPNPEIRRLETAIALREREWHVLQRRYDELEDRYHRARLHPPTSTDEQAKREHERYLRDLRFRLSNLEDDVEDAHRDLDRAVRELSRTPSTVTEVAHESLPYVRETYRKTGRMITRAALQSPGDGGVIAGPFTIEKSLAHTDAMIRGANRELGLPPDPLDLPNDSAVRAALFQETADAAADRLLDDALTHRARSLTEQASASAAAGDAAGALERRVLAVLLRHAARPDTANQALLDLLVAEESTAAVAPTP